MRPAVPAGMAATRDSRQVSSWMVRACRSHTRRLPSLHTTMSRHAPSLLRLMGAALSFKAGSMRLPAGVYTCSMPTWNIEESGCRSHMLYAVDQNICRALHMYQ